MSADDWKEQAFGGARQAPASTGGPKQAVLPRMPEDPVSTPKNTLKKEEQPKKPSWPVMPEDPAQDRSEGVGACPCFIRLRFVKVDGDSASRVLSTLAKLFVKGAIGKSLYHAALEVQVPEGTDCVRYAIEMQDHLSDPDEVRAKGQVSEGNFGAAVIGGTVTSVAGPQYGIRKWRNGEIEGGDDPAVAHPGRKILSRDCDLARRMLGLVASVPTNDYSTDWTSNSVASWLLQKCGLNPGGLSPPVGGLTPNWSNGISQASQ